MSTVSRILNDKDTKAASSEVRERVWQIINETGYVPNANARDLRSSSGKNHGTREKEKSYFACVYARSSDSNDHFFSELANAVKYEAYKKGYILKCSFYASDLNKKSFMATVKDQNISGFVVLGRFANDYANYIMGEQKNVVYVSLNPVDTKHDTIYCNGRKAGMMATEHLLSMGHTEIAYVGEMAKENRFAGYREALMAHGLEVDAARVVEAKQTLEGGYQGARQLCERAAGFSAVFCANDATAMGCVTNIVHHVMADKPESVGLIGCGYMNLMTLAALKKAGVKKLVAFDLDDGKLELAKKYGATDVINSAKEDYVERVYQLTDGKFFDTVIEMCGSLAGLLTACRTIKFSRTNGQLAGEYNGRGRIIITSVYSRQEVFSVDLANEIVLRGPILDASHPMTGEDMLFNDEEAVQLFAEGTIPMDQMISHTIPFTELATGMEWLAHPPAGYIKGVVLF